MKQAVKTEGAPAPIGPYSQGVAASGKMLFVAGQTPKNPKTGQMPEDFAAQVVQCMENVKAIVEAAGASMSDVVRTGVFLRDLANFAVFNEIYAKYFSEPFPARTTVGASLPGGAVQVEIDAIVALPK
jgi:2-iminobutanoate/2-iminopropanoate deaminase